MKVSVVITTYNEPQWLAKVICGYAAQSNRDFELIVADDGSGPETADTINACKAATDLNIVHIWHEDQGFRKTTILNKGIEASRGDYVIFSDGDCIPRNDFVATHVRRRQPNRFLSGGAVRLPLETSHSIGPDDISSGAAFDSGWLQRHGPELPLRQRLKLSAGRLWAPLLNLITPARASWNGGNASAWKRDILAVNGFDQRLQYGAEDREFGERLINAGVRPIQLRYSAITLHLEHNRGYVQPGMRESNDRIRNTVKQSRSTWTDHGIKQDHKL